LNLKYERKKSENRKRKHETSGWASFLIPAQPTSVRPISPTSTAERACLCHFWWAPLASLCRVCPNGAPCWPHLTEQFFPFVLICDMRNRNHLAHRAGDHTGGRPLPPVWYINSEYYPSIMHTRAADNRHCQGRNTVGESGVTARVKCDLTTVLRPQDDSGAREEFWVFVRVCDVCTRDNRVWSSIRAQWIARCSRRGTAASLGVVGSRDFHLKRR
jgi:hypothetical protein